MIAGVIRNILIVGTGSFFGGAARYAISFAMKKPGRGYPWATLAANLMGFWLAGNFVTPH